MNVLFLSETYPPDPGGLAVSARRISTAVETACSQFTRLRIDPHLAPALAVSEPGMIRLGPLPDEDETLQLVEQWICEWPELDLVHAFYGGTLATAAVAAAARRGIPSLVSLRGNDLDRGLYRARASALLQFTLRTATAVTCVSREQVTKLRAWFGVSGEYVANSVDGAQFYPDTPLDDLPAGPRVLFSGEMRWKKGLPLVMEVAEQARGRFSVLLAGGVRGKEKQALKDWRQQHPLASQHLHLLPHTGDRDWLRRLYCSADLVWLPAFWEGMPNALLEAMACARPVLAHAVGGIPDLVVDGTGRLLSLAESGASCQVILELLQAPGELGERARRHVLEHHRPEQEREAYLALYRRLTSSRI